MYFHKLYLIWKFKNKQKTMNKKNTLVQQDNISEIVMTYDDIIFFLQRKKKKKK